MPPPLPPLTLIVATSPTLGIGLRGTLPWPPLKTDLAFFARVTKRAPPPPTSQPTTPPPQTSSHPEPGSTTSTIKTATKKQTYNAVIMGRKTWQSLPPKARPLKGRLNVVVSRDVKALGLPEGVVGVGGVEEGLRLLGTRGEKELGRVFVIGGAEVYRAALGMECCERILWTRVRGGWECDVWFPEGVLEGEGKGGGVRREREEMERWVGEEGVGGWKREGEVEFEVCMLERERGGGGER
ncbi:dihydrofolate reductase-like domain-containing protein [Usnea florida]